MENQEKKPIYITTTLPYVNSDPHVGFAMEIIRADAMARYFHERGHKVFLNTGTDEHGQKIYDKAQENGVDPQTYTDGYAAKFRGLKELLGLYDQLHFIRTTDEHHLAAAQEIWRRCDANGYIYKAQYQTKYCVGCELPKTDSEIVDGKCPIHPTKELEARDEENYFFKFSALQDRLLEYYRENPDFVRPDFRFNEIRNFVAAGLQDFSISRLKSKMPWGVDVPGDDEHVMYVWFDALTNYISTLGWPEDKSGDYHTFWRDGFTVQYAGKDNLRQQSAMWQAMLMAADLPPTDQIVINGFISVDGMKMSKSIGNVISPYDLVEHYGTDAVRYYLLRHMNSFEDSDMSLEKFHEAYTAHLVNGIGNLTSRIMKMAETHLEGPVTVSEVEYPQDWSNAMGSFNIQQAAEFAWRQSSDLDTYIAETKPFKVVKEDPEVAKNIIKELVERLWLVAHLIEPMTPGTSAAIKQAIKENKKPEHSLFERKEQLSL